VHGVSLTVVRGLHWILCCQHSRDRPHLKINHHLWSFRSYRYTLSGIRELPARACKYYFSITLPWAVAPWAVAACYVFMLTPTLPDQPSPLTSKVIGKWRGNLVRGACKYLWWFSPCWNGTCCPPFMLTLLTQIKHQAGHCLSGFSDHVGSQLRA